MKFRRAKKVLMIFLIAFSTLLVLLFIFLNLPVGLRFITGNVNNILKGSGVPVHITSIGRILPKSIYIKGITIAGKENDTIIYAGEIHADFFPFELLKKRIVISDLILIGATIDISRGKENLNIAEAFSGGKKEIIPESSKPKKQWDFSVYNAELSGIRFLMSDSISGIKINQKIGNIKIKINSMSLPGRSVQIHSIEVNESAGSVKISSRPVQKDTEPDSLWIIGLEKAALSNIDLSYNNTTVKQMIALKIREASVGINKLDLNNKVIDFGKISFLNAGIDLLTDSTTEKPKTAQPTGEITFPWNIAAKRINIEDLNLKKGNYCDSAFTFGINNLSADLSDFKFNNEITDLKIARTEFSLDNGFSLKKLKGVIKSHNNETSLELSVETGNSIFNIEGNADGKLLHLISDPSHIRKGFISIMDTELSVEDLLFFKPELRKAKVFNSLKNSVFLLSANASLEDSVINVAEISLEKKNSLKTVLSGNIVNFFSKNREKGEVNLEIPFIDFEWIKSLIPESGFKSDLPEINSLSVSGSIAGSLKSSLFHIGISSNLGNSDITGTYDYDEDSIYAKTVFTDVLAGKLFSNPLLGSFYGSLEVALKDIRKKQPDGNITINFDSLGFKDYVYTNGRLEGKIDDQSYEVRLNMADPSLKCNLESYITTSDSIIDINSSGNIFADLNELNLIRDTLEINGTINADFRKMRDQIQSDLLISDLMIRTPGDYSILTQTKVTFISDSLKTILNAVSDFLELDVQIEKPVEKLGTILPAYKQYATTFTDFSQEDLSKRTLLLPGLKADLLINSHHALGLIFNNSTFNFDAIDLKIINNPSESTMYFNINGNNIEYKGFKIGNLNTQIRDSSGNMNLNSNAETCSFLSKQIDKIVIASSFSKKQGFTEFKILETRDKILYDFGINTVYDSTGIRFSVPESQLTLNAVKWKMERPDLFFIRRSDKKFLISLNIHTDSSFLKLNSNIAEGMQTRLEMDHVALGSFLPVDLIKEKPSAEISGNLSYYSGLNYEKELNADLKINKISWSDINIGLVNLKGNFLSEKPEVYSAGMTATMDSSNIELKIMNKAEGERTINADIMNLNLITFQPFVEKYMSDLKGGISGKLKIQTKGKVTDFDGEINLKEASIRINTLNSIFKIPDDKIRFTSNKIIFDSFKVLDSLDNELQVDGSLNFMKTGSIIADLNISSKNLQVMKSNESENSTFFGDIFVDSKLTIKGPVSSPDLKGNILLAQGTEINFREKENLNLTETEKVLTFIDRSAKPVNTGMKAEKSIHTKSSIDAVVKIDPATIINFQLSKRLFNIDLTIQGGGELNYDMLANQETNLSGIYEISDGTTDVKITGWPNKAFRITKGGSVRWDGKVDDPVLNFEAVSKVHSSYVNPVDNKQRQTDFNVTLKLANRLSELDLLFTINTPDQYLMSIINTLSPEEQMKQAITILLFAKVDLPGISTSSDYMTEQVNQLVASQLNQLTKTTISGIDISFGIDSYVQATQSGGQETKTSLSYEVKKELLNNRAQIEVSGRLNDDENKQSKSNDMSLNNVSFEYRLDSAGTIFLKVYNEHSYEDVFEGEVVKTGVGVAYRKTYERLGDIWRKEDKKLNKNPGNQDK